MNTNSKRRKLRTVLGAALVAVALPTGCVPTANQFGCNPLNANHCFPAQNQR
jgi:hypothetical protein